MEESQIQGSYCDSLTTKKKEKRSRCSLLKITSIIVFMIVFLLLPLKFLFIPPFYLFWIWVLDKDTPKSGGRRIKFVRNLWCWKYFKNYFPVTVHKTDETPLDPNRNYLFCSFPHGIMSLGAVSTFATTAGGFHELYPNHKPHVLTLKQIFQVPIFRDLVLGMGMCSASAASINWLMNPVRKGNVAVLVVGGVEECFHSRPFNYRLVLKDRKGFVRLALKNGSPLVTVFSFGETEAFGQVYNPKGSIIRRLQELIKAITGVAPIIPLGRFNFLFPLTFIPRAKPIDVVIGKPIDVPKIENPTENEVDLLHNTFIQQLCELFETHKGRYLENADRIKLVIV